MTGKTIPRYRPCSKAAWRRPRAAAGPSQGGAGPFGAEGCGSRLACASLDSPKRSRLWRLGGLQGQRTLRSRGAWGPCRAAAGPSQGGAGPLGGQRTLRSRGAWGPMSGMALIAVLWIVAALSVMSSA